MVGGWTGFFFFLLLVVVLGIWEEEGEIVIAIIALIIFGSALFGLMWIGV